MQRCVHGRPADSTGTSTWLRCGVCFCQLLWMRAPTNSCMHMSRDTRSRLCLLRRAWPALGVQSRGVDVETAKREGMAEMSQSFKASGSQVYLPAEQEA